jgi:Tfp pilus assembly protein PilO
MKKAVVLTLAGLGVVVSLFKVQSINHKAEMDKLRAELDEAKLQNVILQSELKACRQEQEDVKERNDKVLAQLLSDFKNFKKSN